MGRAVKSASLYFAGVFTAGFILGTLRTYFLAPSVGETLAVAIELPIMLLVSWIVCRATLRQFRIEEGLGLGIAIGLIAFVLLMSAEFWLATLVFRRATSAYFSGLVSTAGILGLAGQCAFAVMPAIQLLRGPKKS